MLCAASRRPAGLPCSSTSATYSSACSRVRRQTRHQMIRGLSASPRWRTTPSYLEREKTRRSRSRYSLSLSLASRFSLLASRASCADFCEIEFAGELCRLGGRVGERGVGEELRVVEQSLSRHDAARTRHPAGSTRFSTNTKKRDLMRARSSPPSLCVSRRRSIGDRLVRSSSLVTRKITHTHTQKTHQEKEKGNRNRNRKIHRKRKRKQREKKRRLVAGAPPLPRRRSARCRWSRWRPSCTRQDWRFRIPLVFESGWRQVSGFGRSRVFWKSTNRARRSNEGSSKSDWKRTVITRHARSRPLLRENVRFSHAKGRACSLSRGEGKSRSRAVRQKAQ